MAEETFVAEKPMVRAITTGVAGDPIIDREYDIHVLPDQTARSDEEAVDEIIREWIAENESDLLEDYRILQVQSKEIRYSKRDKNLRTWRAMVRFKLRPTQNMDGKPVPSYHFSAATATFTLRHAFEQKQYTAASAGQPVASIHGTALNVEKQNGIYTARGLEVMHPIGNLRITLTFPIEHMAELSWKAFGKIGMVNRERFDAGQGYVFEPEEALFGGAEVYSVSAAECQATYTYLFSPTDNDPEPIDGIAYPSRKGWEYLWAEYETVIGQSEGISVTAQKALRVFLARVYKRTSFDGLMDVT